MACNIIFLMKCSCLIIGLSYNLPKPWSCRFDPLNLREMTAIMKNWQNQGIIKLISQFSFFSFSEYIVFPCGKHISSEL